MGEIVPWARACRGRDRAVGEIVPWAWSCRGRGRAVGVVVPWAWSCRRAWSCRGRRPGRARRYGECVALVDAYTPNAHDTLNADSELTSANHATCAVGEVVPNPSPDPGVPSPTGEVVPWACRRRRYIYR